MTLTKATQDMIDGQGTAAVLNVGVAENNIPQMDATGYPAADGSQITGLTTNVLFQDTEKALAAANSVEWTGFSAGNTFIRIVAELSAGGDGSDPIIQLGDAGGYETSGYVGLVYDVIGNTEDTAQTAHIPLTLAGASSKAASTNHIVVEMNKVSELTERWVISTSFWQVGGDTEYVTGTVTKTLSAEITQVKLFSDDSTNWSSGTALLYRNVN